MNRFIAQKAWINRLKKHIVGHSKFPEASNGYRWLTEIGQVYLNLAHLCGRLKLTLWILVNLNIFTSRRAARSYDALDHSCSCSHCCCSDFCFFWHWNIFNWYFVFWIVMIFEFFQKLKKSKFSKNQIFKKLKSSKNSNFQKIQFSKKISYFQKKKFKKNKFLKKIKFSK